MYQMARPLSSFPNMFKHNFFPASFTFLILFSVFSAVIFLCGAAHKAALKSLRSKDEKPTVRLGGKSNTPIIKKLKSGLSSKALLMAKMISWRKVVDEGEAPKEVFEYAEDDGEEGVVWKKAIIRGEKCRPLDFSGKILYDSEGNLLPE